MSERQWVSVTLTTEVEKAFRDFAEERIETLWREGRRMGFDVPDLLLSAYLQGFTDCADVAAEPERLRRIMTALGAPECHQQGGGNG